MTTTSGASGARELTASSPVAASPTTSVSETDSSSAREATAEERVVVGDDDPDRGSLIGPRRRGGGKRAATSVPRRPRADLAGATDLRRALPHRVQADADAEPLRARAVVFDLEPQRIRLDRETDGARARVRVPPDVGQRLLRDPVRGDLDGGRELGQRGRRVDGDDASCRRLPRREAAERGGEPELVERRGPQAVDQPADVPIIACTCSVAETSSSSAR